MRIKRRSLQFATVFLVFCSIQFATRAETTINDVTQLNPIVVRDVIVPTTIDEIVAAVKTHQGPISIGGGRYSMGGQTATEGALQIDMRQFDKVVNFSKEKKEITVQTGITWRKIQEFIDPHDLSLRIMQTYANFTVGGSLSVNVHGRYIGQGPLVMSVKSIRVVLPNGTLIQANPNVNRDVFYGAIGGYGGLGVIVEATLMLADNVKVERRSIVMPLREYKDYFFKNIRENPAVIFHNADIYPTAYDTMRVTSYFQTDKPVTEPHRLPPDQSYWRQHVAMWVVSEAPFGKWLRQHVTDPWYYGDDLVEWRNFEASYDVKELEPASRKDSTYVLQEYFVPVEKLDEFMPRMASTLNRHRVNAINVSIRHAKQDPGTLLAWAKTEVFAFVLYYKQGTSDADKKAVALWTRELIDAAIAVGGAYYLPYQIHATPMQFHAAYPNAEKFFALKKKLDPGNKFRNKLWDAYYRAPDRSAHPGNAARDDIRAELAHFPGYKRDMAQTYLTVPEWFLVYSPAEYASFLKDQPPASFPYFGSIAQFWSYYRDAYNATKDRYGFNWGYHVMVFVIGSSFTVENAVKGVYESTVGRATQWIAGGGRTPEDEFGARVAQEYVDFIRVEPWYEFSFATRLKKLWAETDLFGPNLLRKWERKFSLSLEYLAKAQYALLIKVATKAAYGDADDEMLAWIGAVPSASLAGEAKVKTLRKFENGDALVALPRYEEFRDVSLRLARRGVRFEEIAGNDEILLTSVVPSVWRYDLSSGKVAFEKPILTSTNGGSKRVAIVAPVRALHDVLNQLGSKGFAVEHIYDY